MNIINQPKLEFCNSFGLVFEDYLCLLDNKHSSFIYVNNLKKIQLIKRREFIFNFLIFIISCALLYFTFTLQFESVYIKVLLYCVSIGLILGAFLYKKYDYNVVLITGDFQPLTIKVDKNNKSEAKDLVINVNKKLQVSKSLSRAS